MLEEHFGVEERSGKVIQILGNLGRKYDMTLMFYEYVCAMIDFVGEKK